MLEVFLHDEARSITFVLAGTLTRPWTQQLEQSWRTVVSILKDKQLIVDLVRLSGFDEEGMRLLTEMSLSGARLITGSDSMDRLAQDISGRIPILLPAPPPNFFNRMLCRFTRCCARFKSLHFFRRGCGAPPLKAW